MSSCFRYVPRIACIGLMASALVLIDTTANATTHQEADHFVVTVYSDSRGSQDLLMGQYDAALDDFKQVLQLKPDLASLAYGQITSINQQLGRLDEALEAIKHTIQFDTQD